MRTGCSVGLHLSVSGGGDCHEFFERAPLPKTWALSLVTLTSATTMRDRFNFAFLMTAAGQITHLDRPIAILTEQLLRYQGHHGQALVWPRLWAYCKRSQNDVHINVLINYPKKSLITLKRRCTDHESQNHSRIFATDLIVDKTLCGLFLSC